MAETAALAELVAKQRYLQSEPVDLQLAVTAEKAVTAEPAEQLLEQTQSEATEETAELVEKVEISTETTDTPESAESAELVVWQALVLLRMGLLATMVRTAQMVSKYSKNK
jgi:hypothetical protein